MESIEVRQRLVEALLLDLVGPFPGSPLESETLPQTPSRWYLTGFLIPAGAPEKHAGDEGDDEQLDLQAEAGATDDEDPPEPPSARRANLPSSIGLSVLLPHEARTLQVTARWGDYRAQRTGPEDKTPQAWTRTQCVESLHLALPAATTRTIETPIPGSNGLVVALTVRPVHGEAAKTAGSFAAGSIPAGARSISVFLVNHRTSADDEVKDEAYAFQAELVVDSPIPFVPRESGAGANSSDWDDRVADLQYRDAREFAVGHGIATETCCDANGACLSLRTRGSPRPRSSASPRRRSPGWKRAWRRSRASPMASGRAEAWAASSPPIANGSKPRRKSIDGLRHPAARSPYTS